MTCSWCAHDFEEATARAACVACNMFGGGGCQRIRCPRCGYEMPEEPAFVKKLRAWARRREEKRSASNG